MTSRDFCYWLQGPFEVTDLKSLTVEQVEIIDKHLNMVFEYEKKIEINFCIWLRGFMDAQGPVIGPMTTENTQMIKDKLNGVFTHVIDPLYGDKAMQDKLNAIHNGKPTLLEFGKEHGFPVTVKPDPNDVVYKC